MISMLCQNLGLAAMVAAFVVCWREYHNEHRAEWLRELARIGKWIALVLIMVCVWVDQWSASFAAPLGFVAGCLFNYWGVLNRIAEWWTSPPKPKRPAIIRRVRRAAVLRMVPRSRAAR
jgi:hypothetical protein